MVWHKTKWLKRHPPQKYFHQHDSMNDKWVSIQIVSKHDHGPSDLLIQHGVLWNTHWAVEGDIGSGSFHGLHNHQTPRLTLVHSPRGRCLPCGGVSPSFWGVTYVRGLTHTRGGRQLLHPNWHRNNKSTGINGIHLIERNKMLHWQTPKQWNVSEFISDSNVQPTTV